MSEEFKQYVTDSGVNFDAPSSDEKRQWRESFDKSLLLRQQPAGSGDGNYSNFPLYFDLLRKMGLETPYEQYILYVSCGAFLYGAYTPMRKAFFLNRWLHETDPSLKDIWAARVNLSTAEQRGGERYLQELKRVPKRYAVIPLSFLLIESFRIGYRKLGDRFSGQWGNNEN
eukprot:gene29885-36082_t